MKTIHDCPTEIQKNWFQRTQWCKANGIDPKEGDIFDEPIKIDPAAAAAKAAAEAAAEAAAKAKRLAKFNKREAQRAEAAKGYTLNELIRTFVEVIDTMPDSHSRKVLSRAIDICQQQGGFAADVATTVERSGRCSEKQAFVIANASVKGLNELFLAK